MAKTSKDLSAEQKAAYEATLAKYGINSNQVAKTVNTGDYPSGLDVGLEQNCTKKVPISDIDELNEKMGFPCEHYTNGKADDSDIEYPQEFEQCKISKLNSKADDFRTQLCKEDHNTLSKALSCCLHGNSQKMAKYKPAINAAFFKEPVIMAVHAAQDITISKDHPLVVKSKGGKTAHLIYGTVTIEPGGYILAEVPFTITSQVVTVL